jgi:hypothetical protein
MIDHAPSQEQDHEQEGPICAQEHWRFQAARIVEELFAHLPARAFDSLLDLRQALLQDADLRTVIDCFLACRREFETDAYLPFYRLRVLLSASLRLQGAGLFGELPLPPVEALLRKRHASFAEWKKQLQREWFEQGLDSQDLEVSPLSLIEIA